MYFNHKEKLTFKVESVEEFKARGGKVRAVNFSQAHKPLLDTKAEALHKERMIAVAKSRKLFNNEPS